MTLAAAMLLVGAVASLLLMFPERTAGALRPAISRPFAPRAHQVTS